MSRVFGESCPHKYNDNEDGAKDDGRHSEDEDECEDDDDLEDWREVPVDDSGPHGGVLAEGELEEEGGDPDDEQHQEVRDQEGAAAVLEVGDLTIFTATCFITEPCSNRVLTVLWLQKRSI